MLNLKTIASGSKGNCYIIDTENESLLIECGVKYKRILSALHFDLTKVSGCLLSHAHGDHSIAIKDVTKAGIDIYSSQGTFDKLGVKGHRAKIIKAKERYQIGGFSIMPFDTQHDCEEPLGFIIYHLEFGKLLFATDTYYIKYKVPGLNYVMIECNYEKSILESNIKSGVTSDFLRKRLLSSHFSLENVKKFFKANDLSQLRRIYLMHLSDGNSNEELFKTEIEKATGVPVEICKQ
jgi:phosphoribosyl 1,2-cyclic phosphodiesterase